MNSIKTIYIIIAFLIISCGKENNKNYILESNLDKITIEFPDSKKVKEYKIGKYKIDYSTDGFIKIFYSENSIFKTPKTILLRKNGKYYNDFDLNSKDSLSAKSHLFFSKNPNDSYRTIEKISNSNLEPPPPYFSDEKNYFEYFDDSIIFKKKERLNLMYIKDNNLDKISSSEYYYDENYRIIKIIEKFGKTEIEYK